MPKQKKNWLKILIILIIAAGVITLGYFIYKRQVATTEKALSSPTPTTKSSDQPKVSSKNNPNGPYYHQIYSAISTDGLTWNKQNKMLFDHASVPGAVIKNNKIYLYFVDASDDEDQLSMVVSTDNGKTFGEKQKVKVQNTPTYAIVDPHPELVDGKIRLYYFSNPMTPDQKKEPEVFRIYSAISNDGVNFDNPQMAFESPVLITDPDVFETSKDWRMFVSEGTKLVLTVSTDGGITFKKDENFSWNKGGVCDTAKIGDIFHTFYCGEGGIKSATGAETGKLTTEDGVRLSADAGQIVCDPSIIKLEDGSYLMFYKTQEVKKQGN